jgi:putative transposase
VLAVCFPVSWLCKQLDVDRSGLYAWRQRQQKRGCRVNENAVIPDQVQAVFGWNHGFYGAPRIHQELKTTGLKVGRHRVARLTRVSAIKAKTRRAFSPYRNRERKTSCLAENLLLQEFSPAAPNRCWAGDINYIRTTTGWRYLAALIVLY